MTRPGSLPLQGKTAVAVCSLLKSEAVVTGLQSLGAEVITFQAIEARPVHDTAPVESALRKLPSYDWLVLTSAHAVLFFMELAGKRGVSIPDTLRVCAVGPATAARAEAAGLKVDLVPTRFIAEGVVEALSGTQPLAGLKVLFPRAVEGRDVIPAALRSAGAYVDLVPVYENVTGSIGEGLIMTLRQGKVDLILFTSSSAVASFVAILGETDGRRLLRTATVAALGPVTADTTAAFGKKPEIVAAESTVRALISAIAAYYTERPASAL